MREIIRSSRLRTKKGSLLVIVLTAASLACLEGTANAESNWSVRLTGATGVMASSQQRSGANYMFDQPAALAGAAVARALRPWFEMRAGAQAVGFFSSRESPGGLLAVSVGPVLRGVSRFSPHVGLGIGGGLTGRLIRPFFSVDGGLDYRLTARTTVGPAFGFGQLVQRNGPQSSSDARYFWMGLSLRLVSRDAAPPARSPPKRAVPVRTEPAVAEAAVEPTPDVVELIERALPSGTQRVELLAPVLFEGGAAELSPTAEAMLHEVASLLKERSSIELVEIRGYADERGSAQFNHDLSRRRAERVRMWLVEHGVSADRLTISSLGEAEPREESDRATAHEQNRRVIFRILKETAR